MLATLEWVDWYNSERRTPHAGICRQKNMRITTRVQNLKQNASAKGKTKKGAGKVKHKGKKAKNAAKH